MILTGTATTGYGHNVGSLTQEIPNDTHVYPGMYFTYETIPNLFFNPMNVSCFRMNVCTCLGDSSNTWASNFVGHINLARERYGCDATNGMATTCSELKGL